MMKINYDRFLTTAEKVHIQILRILTTLLTFAMWLLVLGGLGAVWLFSRYGVRLSSIALVLLFLLLYGGFQILLIWVSLLCRRLRIAKRIIIWTFIWIPVINFFLALYVKGLAGEEIDHTLYIQERGVCVAYQLGHSLLIHPVVEQG